MVTIAATAQDRRRPRCSEELSDHAVSRTAVRLARYFGTSAEVWIGLQADYDLRIAERAAGAEVERAVRSRAA